MVVVFIFCMLITEAGVISVSVARSSRSLGEPRSHQTGEKIGLKLNIAQKEISTLSY
jgi:hypothetical protein